MKRFLPLFFLLIHGYFSTCQNIRKAPTPSWVKVIQTDNDSILEDLGESQYLLLDFQYNLANESVFFHYKIKILNSEGIQSNSDIDISFDPSYQTLTLHQVDLIRDGKRIPKLYEEPVKKFQRETSMERSLYDGSISAVMNLKDVREGDILEYSFSRKGFNPINKGNFSTTFSQNYSTPVNRIYNRIVFPKVVRLQYKLYNEAVKPISTETQGLKSYEWDMEGYDYVDYDKSIPSWFNAQKKVRVSTYKSWREVVEWALPLYTYDVSSVKKFGQEISSASTKEGKILDLIDWVQNDVRYLGFEEGIGAYKPNAPAKVYKQRFGDCKDKSLLLVSLLRSEGVEAYPLLVNTTYQQEIENFLPSGGVFDHCVVYFEFDEKEFFIDPTISSQGGDLLNRQFPNYKKGLLIKEGEESIITAGRNPFPLAEQHVREYFQLESVGGNTSFKVETTYLGDEADQIRSYFASNSRKDIQDEYLDYYSTIYSDMVVTKDLVYIDSLKDSENKIITEEYYTIEGLWTLEGDSTYYLAEVYPLVFSYYVDYTKSSKRSMPLYVGRPKTITYHSYIKFPEKWPVSPASKTINHKGFTYISSATKEAKDSMVIKYRLDLTQDYLNAEDAMSFYEKMEDAHNDLGFQFTYNLSSSDKPIEINWIALSAIFLVLILGTLGAIYLYRNYNPTPLYPDTSFPIGGWLILPAIGITITPLFAIIRIYRQEYFSQAIYDGIDAVGKGTNQLGFLVGVELVYNHLYIVFSILLVVLFYKKRSSLPSLASIFYAVAFLIPLIDIIWLESISPDYLDEASKTDTYGTIGRSLISALIWIPYFNISKRVKQTFVKVYRGAKKEKES
ncbi:MAG: DUF3857 domain-containing protein [Bacteroidota bacterium]